MRKPVDALEEALQGDAVALAELVSLLTPSSPAPAPAANARQRLLAKASSPGLRWAPLFDELSRLFDLPDGELSKLGERSADPSQWQAIPIAGVELFHLTGGPQVGAADAGLVRVQPGLVFPEHTHLGEERTLILEGEARESSGQLRRPGDVLVMPGDSSHAFQVTSERPLIYALVLFGGVQIGDLRLP
ncbi:MAG: cupin domain-containing protein [Polyangiaceae bacterium]